MIQIKPTPIPTKSKRNRPATKPVNLRKACEVLGTTTVAERLGYADSSIYTMLTADECVKVVEVAAASLLDNEKKNPTESYLYVVKVPTQYRDPVEKTLRAFECKFRHFVE